MNRSWSEETLCLPDSTSDMTDFDVSIPTIDDEEIDDDPADSTTEDDGMPAWPVLVQARRLQEVLRWLDDEETRQQDGVALDVGDVPAFVYPDDLERVAQIVQELRRQPQEAAEAVRVSLLQRVNTLLAPCELPDQSCWWEGEEDIAGQDH